MLLTLLTNSQHDDGDTYKALLIQIYMYLYADERNSRRKIFLSNLARVKEGQKAFDLGQRSYDVEINCFGDMSFREFGTSNTGFGVLGG